MGFIMPNTKIPGAGSHHFAISSAHYEESVKFYTEGLGMKIVAEWGENEGRGILLDIGDGSHVEIFANGNTEAQKNEKIVHFAITTTDTDLAFNNAIAAGAREQMPPTSLDIPADPPISVRIAFVYGPDNELVEFFKTVK